MKEISDKNLINQLSSLKRLKPDENWVIFCRGKLEASISANNATEPELRVNMAKTDFWALLAKFMPSRAILRPALSLSFVFVVIFGSSIYIVAKAKDSLPGDRLFPVKIALEQARLLTIPSIEDKANIKSDIVVTRLAELNKIMSAQEPAETKKRKLEEAVNNLQKQLITLNDDLPKLDKVDAKKAVEVAKKIDTKADEVQKALSDARAVLVSETDQQSLSEMITETANIADKTSDQLLQLMIKIQDDSDAKNQALAMLKTKVQNAENRMKMLNESFGNEKMPPEIENLLVETGQTLEKAQASLNQAETEETLQMVKSAEDMLSQAENIAENAIPAKQPEKDGQEQPKVDNSTSTPSATGNNSIGTSTNSAEN